MPCVAIMSLMTSLASSRLIFCIRVWMCNARGHKISPEGDHLLELRRLKVLRQLAVSFQPPTVRRAKERGEERQLAREPRPTPREPTVLRLVKLLQHPVEVIRVLGQVVGADVGVGA